MIETETVNGLPMLRRKVKTSSAVCFCGAKYGHTILGTIRYGHARDRSASGVKHDAFDFLSKLWLVDDDEFSDCPSGRDEEGAHKHEGYQSIHSSIIDGASSPSKDSHGCRNQAISLKTRQIAKASQLLSRWQPCLFSHLLARSLLFCRSLEMITEAQL